MKMRLLLLGLVCLALFGCNTTKIPAPITMDYPGDLTKEQAMGALLVAYAIRRPSELPAKVQIADHVADAVLLRYQSIEDSRIPWKVIYFDSNKLVFGIDVRMHHLEATFTLGDHTGSLAISGSRNLKQSGNSIHERAPLWLSRLDTNIRAVLATAAANIRQGN